MMSDTEIGSKILKFFNSPLWVLFALFIGPWLIAYGDEKLPQSVFHWSNIGWLMVIYACLTVLGWLLSLYQSKTNPRAQGKV